MQNQLLENLFAYKKTAALLAAFQLGLFRQIKENGCLNNETYRQLGWNERYAELLCIYLSNEGYLTDVEGSWKISTDFENQLDAFEKICEHERSLYHKWLSPELIASTVQSVTDGRLFEEIGFTPEEQSAYDNAMYGNNVNLIVFHLLRKIKRDRTSLTRYLEYGKSAGRIGQALKKHIPEIRIDIVLPNQAIDSELLYEAILIYNTIHYKTPKEFETFFCQMKKMLSENGVICIADIFYREDNTFQSTVLLDWITHGGVYNIDNHEVFEHLQSVGFTKVEQQSIDSISTELFFAYK